MQHLRLLCFSWINWVLRIVFVEVLLLMTCGISFEVSFFVEYETSTGFGCTDDAVTVVAEGMLKIDVKSDGFDDGKTRQIGELGLNFFEMNHS